jgi:hypothetical protein
MEDRRFGILRELVDALKDNADAVKHALIQTRLDDWIARLDALGNVQDRKDMFGVLADIAYRVAGGDYRLLEKLSQNRRCVEELNDVIPRIGDLQAFRDNLTSLQQAAGIGIDWKRRSETYERLMKDDFPRRLEAFETAVGVLSRLAFDEQD